MLYRFANCRLDTDRHVFERDGAALRIEPQVFDLLLLLVRSAGELVTPDRLVAEVWRGLHVSDAAISARINAARKAVGDDGKAQKVIETVARRGFRLAMPVAAEAPETHPWAPPAAAAPAATPRRPAAFSDDFPTLAVLPFRYQAEGPHDILADGIVDQITSTLSRVGDFHVVARQSAVALPPGSLDAPTAARTLGADYLVEGSVQRGGERLRIGVSLLDAQGRTLWSSRYDDRLDDLFDLEDRIAVQVAGQLPVKLRVAEIERAQASGMAGDGAGGGADPVARAFVLRALPLFWAHEREANALAIALWSRALEIDPNRVRALAYKAWAIAQKPAYMWSTDVRADRAEALALARRAAELVGGDDPPALVAISAAFSLAGAEPASALAFVRRALEIDPNNAWGRMRLGWALNYCGRPAEALPEFEQARRLSPLDPFLYNMRIGTAIAQVGLRNLDAAVAIVEDVIAGTPQVTWAWRILASIHGQRGDAGAAAAATRRLVEAYPGLTRQQLDDAVPPGMARQGSTYLMWRLPVDAGERPD